MPFVVDHTPVQSAGILAMQSGQVAKDERDRQADRQDLLALETQKRTQIEQQQGDRRYAMDQARLQFDQKQWRDELRYIDRQSKEKRKKYKQGSERFSETFGIATEMFGEDPEMQEALLQFEQLAAEDPDTANSQLWGLMNAEAQKQDELEKRPERADAFMKAMETVIRTSPVTDAMAKMGYFQIMAGAKPEDVYADMAKIASGEEDEKKNPMFNYMNTELENERYFLENYDPQFGNHEEFVSRGAKAAKIESEISKWRLTGEYPQRIHDLLTPPSKQSAISGGQQELMLRGLAMQAMKQLGITDPDNMTKEQIQAVQEKVDKAWPELLKKNKLTAGGN